MKTAVFPGSFDPIHNGHVEIITKAAEVFDKVIVAVGENTSKQYMFTLEERFKWVAETFKGHSNIEVKKYQGLTADFCRNENAKFIVRGLRSSIDFEFEKPIALTNQSLNSSLETIFFLSSSKTSFINSTIIREVLRNKGNVSHLVPPKPKD